MANLKRINSAGVGVALDKAQHYRLLNEPMHAESICLDVLEVEPDNQRALVMLILSLTDQFPNRLYDALQRAKGLLPQLLSEYDRVYYEGIVHERWANVQFERGSALTSVPEWLGKAMRCYELAEKLTDGKNPDPILRWNTCARLSEKMSLNEPVSESVIRDIQGEFGPDV
ncbi:MAG: hypothetical protein ABL888_07340 [Pirellulaceae bacterium]